MSLFSKLRRILRIFIPQCFSAVTDFSSRIQARGAQRRTLSSIYVYFHSPTLLIPFTNLSLTPPTQGLGYGIWDGLSGLYTQPATGISSNGVAGFFSGLGKGIGGAVFKPVAGAVGLPAYAIKGVYEEVARLTGGSEEDKERAERLKQGNEEWSMCTGEERKAILGMWYTFNAQEGIKMQDQEGESGKWN